MVLHKTLPAGNYYIGDLCHVLDDKIYRGVWEKNNFKSDKYKVGNGVFVVDSTDSGDGTYKGSNEFMYIVDAGNIGIVSQNLISMDYKNSGSFHTFTSKVSFISIKGLFIIESGSEEIIIDTR